ncbi:hypothetical protein TM239_27030 [Bradyrhizobium sp. TM239]|nr:hypothetical protein TM239_27030 [Bradyrhizobium sp. TM239]
MAGVRKQGGGVSDIAVDRFGHHQRGVERNADREGLAELRGRMNMAVTAVVTMTMVGMIMVVMTVMVVAAQF